MGWRRCPELVGNDGISCASLVGEDELDSFQRSLVRCRGRQSTVEWDLVAVETARSGVGPNLPIGLEDSQFDSIGILRFDAFLLCRRHIAVAVRVVVGIFLRHQVLRFAELYHFFPLLRRAREGAGSIRGDCDVEVLAVAVAAATSEQAVRRMRYRRRPLLPSSSYSSCVRGWC